MNLLELLPTTWRWSWEDVCGPGGFQIWSARTHDLGVCFQQLCLQIPVLFLLAIFSSYYFGRNRGRVTRDRVQKICIKLRCCVVFLLGSLPLIQIYINLYKTNEPIPKIAYLLSAVQVISWFTHFFFTLSLRHKEKSPRGPLIVTVLWSWLFLLSLMSLRSHINLYKSGIIASYAVYLSYSFSICYFILQISYSLTLLPIGEEAHYIHSNGIVQPLSETTPLFTTSYERFSDDTDPTYLGTAMENTPWLSKLLFYWVNPLMEKGVMKGLQESDDLFDLPVSMNADIISAKLEKMLIGNVDSVLKKRTHVNVDNESSASCSQMSPDITFVKVRKYNVTLLTALHRCFWLQFYGLGFLKVVADCAGFAGPMLLNKLVSFIEDKSLDAKWGYIYAAALTASTLIGSLCDSHFTFQITILGLKMRSALVTTIYRKTLTVSSTVLNNAFSVGEIVNFMSTDTDRIVNAGPSFHDLWSIPFQLGVTLYLLYSLLGGAFLAGVAFSIILIPINKVIASKIGQLSVKLMEHKDERIKIITEVLRGIKAVKLYVWEQHFIRLITKLREQELKYLKGRKYLDALCVYFWATTPVLISILTFGTYVLLGHKLNAATVFTGIALLNMLISPLNSFPWVLNGLTEAWVSIKRIQRLLDLPDLDLSDYYNDNLLESDPNYDILMQGGEYSWGKELNEEEIEKLHSKTKKTFKKHSGRTKSAVQVQVSLEHSIFSLKGIDLKIRKGEFVGIIGTVGSGKSSILSAILAEVAQINGSIATTQMESGFGFVTQQPWLQRGTVRDNILFGKTYDDAKYKLVLHSCGLAEDIFMFPNGDLTSVGEGGTTLSGGQKARIALARAVYQDKTVYLLDDILSAVDPKVARHIFKHCIMGILRDKTRVLCTHLIEYLIHADRIVLLDKGTINQQGKPAEVLSNMDSSIQIDLELGNSPEYGESFKSSLSLMDSIKQDSVKSRDIAEEETKEEGNVNFNVYSFYWKSIGHLLSLSVLLSIIIMQTTRNMSDLWLSHWVTSLGDDVQNTTNSSRLEAYLDHPVFMDSLTNSDNETLSFYLEVYVGFAVINSIFTLSRAFLFAYGGITAASTIHKLLLKSVLKGKATFFDITPIGRILNRFSSDTYTVDDSLPFILNILLAQFFGLVGTVLVTIYGMPWVCLVLVPLVPVYHWLQYHYRLTSRELKRISSVTLSPVYSHFNESLQGLSTIRAMRATQRFKRENEDNIDSNMKAQFSSQAAARWLGLRLQFIGVSMAAGISFIAVIQHNYDTADPGLIGLAMSYALSVTVTLRAVVSAFTETEREMISVERVKQYITEVPPENQHYIIDPPFGWPNHGVVSFNNVTLKYRENLSPSLRLVTFETRPCEKIGVVGRTGAGKSSLISGIFRIIEAHSGSICIDSVNVSHISLAALRSRMFCIPQEPFLFSGTMRENLDPLAEFNDNEIWSALTKVNLGDTIKALGGLQNVVEAGGANFSVGQKQLICLARAVLHNAKILCIDEATANVDQETDRHIQRTLRLAFRNCTVLTIAHRVQTILDSDRVLVMHDGQLVEFDTPDNLSSDTSSLFYQLINQE